jgi:hypothetical protein
MANTVRMILMSVMMPGLVACGSLQSAQQSPVAEYPFRHSAFDQKVAWKTSLIDRNLVINGLLKNVRYLQIDDVELTVSVIDKDNKTLARNRTLFLPVPIKMDDYVPFGLTVENVTLTRGDVLSFLIKYRAYDGDSSSFTWLSSFKTDALTGATINEEIVNPDRW